MDLEAFLADFDRRDWQEAEEGTIRFATVGLGWWTRERAIPALAESSLCEATVAVSGDRPDAEALADSGELDHESIEHALTYDEFQDGDATDAYDTVYVATPNALHLPHVEAAADHGKHVLCEKPMEASVDRATAMVEACEDAGVRLMVGYRMQTEPAIRRARDLVRAGFVGDPAHVQSHMTQRLLAMNDDPDQWRLDPELAGPGASVTDLGIYAINTARFVLDADPVRVQGMMDSTHDAFDAVPDERASFGLELAPSDGAATAPQSNAFAACSASQHAHDGGRFTVIGTDGELTLEPAFFDDDRRRLTVARGGSSAEVAFETVDQMTEEFDYFADRILTDRKIHPDGRHGLTDVRTIEAVYEAAERGETVPVE